MCSMKHRGLSPLCNVKNGLEHENHHDEHENHHDTHVTTAEVLDALFESASSQ